MKIVSKRGKKPAVEVSEIDLVLDVGGVIIINPYGMTPEETQRAEEAIKELRRQLDQLGHIMDGGWFGDHDADA